MVAMLADIGQEAGYTLDRSPVYHMAYTETNNHSLLLYCKALRVVIKMYKYRLFTILPTILSYQLT